MFCNRSFLEGILPSAKPGCDMHTCMHARTRQTGMRQIAHKRWKTLLYASVWGIYRLYQPFLYYTCNLSWDLLGLLKQLLNFESRIATAKLLHQPPSLLSILLCNIALRFKSVELLQLQE